MLDPDDAEMIEGRAASSGLPATLWATKAIEATRSVNLVEAALSLSSADIHELLSAAAADKPWTQRWSRLNDYAHALRVATPRPAASIGLRRIALNPGLASATAWNSEAHAAGISFETWLRNAIATAPSGFVPWEAAAADAGRCLAEWALVQAARRRRSASTPAQTAGY